MIEIDGSLKSGSGTILRLSIALAALTNQPLHIFNIRQKRPHPGLRPQHLEAVLVASKLCDASVKGATVGSRELWFAPKEVKGGEVQAEIGTAGSIPMLLMTVLPLCAFAEKPVTLHVVKGGTDVRNAPTINYVKNVLLPSLEKMGVRSSLTIHKYGYYPKGMGEVTLHVEPCHRLNGIRLEEFGELKTIEGISVCTFLAERKVAERQAKAAEEFLKKTNCKVSIEIMNDASNPLQKGSSLALWAKTSTGVLIGSDAIGELKKTSETVGKEAAENLLTEIEARATADIHLADMLVPYMALAQDRSVFLCRFLSEHLETNIWLAEKILNAKFNISRRGKLYQVEKKT